MVYNVYVFYEICQSFFVCSCFVVLQENCFRDKSSFHECFLFCNLVVYILLVSFISDSRSLSDVVMNFVGVFMWLAVGAIALHYWGGYQGEHQFQFVFAERQVSLYCFVSSLTGYLTLVNSVNNFIFI